MVEQSLKIIRAGTLAEAGIRHGFATRLGGASTAYLRRDSSSAAGHAAGELNLGFTPSDPRENVLTNRRSLLVNVFGKHLPMVTLHQVHSGVVHRVDHADAGEEALLQGDGLITDEPGIVLGIQTADCVPVLVADKHRGVAAAFHAGWRGTLQRIVEAGIALMRAEYGSKPGDLVAAIGPSIRQCCYSVGDEVQQQFRTEFLYADSLFNRGLPTCLDLVEANKRQLIEAGIRKTAIEVVPLCTSCRTDLFFSYRAEQGHTGRMLSVIGL